MVTFEKKESFSEDSLNLLYWSPSLIQNSNIKWLLSRATTDLQTALDFCLDVFVGYFD